MRKGEGGRPPGRHPEKPDEGGAGRVSPEDDFSPLGGYQPKRGPAGDFVIPSGKSKALPGDANAGQSTPAAEGSKGDQGKGHVEGKK